MTDQPLFRSADATTEVRPSGGERPVRSLVVDGVVQGDDSPRGLVMESRQGLVPALMCAGAHDVLAIGVGTGITLGALVAGLGGARVTAVERSPAVLEAARLFRDHWARPIDRPPVTLVAADGREYLAAADARFDLIACDLLNPADAAGLFTRAFYGVCADRLTDGGVVTQWLPLFQMPPGALRRVVRAFADVFPDAALWLAGFSAFKPVALLVGGRRASPLGSQRAASPSAHDGMCHGRSCPAVRRRGESRPDKTGRSTPGGPSGPGPWAFETDAVTRALSAVPAAGLATPERVESLHVLDTHGLRRLAGDARPFDDGEVLVDARAARAGLADGGLANLAAIVAARKGSDPFRGGGQTPFLVQRAFFEASCAAQRGEWAVALAGYRHVWQVWPDDPLVRLAAASASCSHLMERALDLWAGGEVEGAEVALRQAIAAAPDRSDAHESLAKLLTALGRHDEALAAIEGALAIDPDDPDLHASRAAIRHNLARERSGDA